MELHVRFSVSLLSISLYLCTTQGLYYSKYKSNSLSTGRGSAHRHPCHANSLEKAEEEANVVFTGTIMDLYRDWDHPDMMKAKVKVKRIFKGSNVVNTLPDAYSRTVSGHGHHRTITVEGMGDPHICHSKARKWDTRIFLANKGANGELKLNSSLVRLTLSNLEHAEAAVKSKAYILNCLSLYTVHSLNYTMFGVHKAIP